MSTFKCNVDFFSHPPEPPPIARRSPAETFGKLSCNEWVVSVFARRSSSSSLMWASLPASAAGKSASNSFSLMALPDGPSRELRTRVTHSVRGISPALDTRSRSAATFNFAQGTRPSFRAQSSYNRKKNFSADPTGVGPSASIVTDKDESSILADDTRSTSRAITVTTAPFNSTIVVWLLYWCRLGSHCRFMPLACRFCLWRGGRRKTKGYNR